jgi:hypothetical protein
MNKTVFWGLRQFAFGQSSLFAFDQALMPLMKKSTKETAEKVLCGKS